MRDPNPIDQGAPCHECGAEDHDDRRHRLVLLTEMPAFMTWAIVQGWEARGTVIAHGYEVARLFRKGRRKWLSAIYYKRSGSPYASPSGQTARQLAREWLKTLGLGRAPQAADQE